jgi:hypothetical protein
LGEFDKIILCSHLLFLEAAVAPEERKRLDDLCRKVQDEKDPKKFDGYGRELNDLLEEKHTRTHPEHNHKT